MINNYQEAIYLSRRGYKEGYDFLYASTVQSVYEYLVRETGNVDMADSLIAEVYENAWTRIGEVADPDTFPQWIISVAEDTADGGVTRMLNEDYDISEDEDEEEEEEKKERSFFSTMAGKIAIGAGSAVVLAALVVGGIFFLGKNDDQDIVNAETIEAEADVDVDQYQSNPEGATEAGLADKMQLLAEKQMDAEKKEYQELTATANEEAKTADADAASDAVIPEVEVKADSSENNQVKGSSKQITEFVKDVQKQAEEEEKSKAREEAEKKAEEEAKKAEQKNQAKRTTDKIDPSEENAEMEQMETNTTPAEEEVKSGKVTLRMTWNKQEMNGQTFYLYPTWKTPDNCAYYYLCYRGFSGWDMNLLKEARQEITFGENGEATVEVETGKWILTDEDSLVPDTVYEIDITSEQIKNQDTITIGMELLPDRYSDESGNYFRFFSDGSVEGRCEDKDGHAAQYKARFEFVGDNSFVEEGDGYYIEHWEIRVKCTSVEEGQVSPFVEGHEYVISGKRLFGDTWIGEGGCFNWSFVVLDEEGNDMGYSFKI